MGTHLFRQLEWDSNERITNIEKFELAKVTITH